MARILLAWARIWVLLAVTVLTAGLGAQTAGAANAGGAAAKAAGANTSTVAGKTAAVAESTKLAAARANLGKIQNTETFTVTLEGYAYSLPPHDAVTLFREFLPRLEGRRKIDLATLGGSLALMTGRYEDAASIFRQAAPEDPELGVQAARSYLAAGNSGEARAVLEMLQGQELKAPIKEKMKLTLAWLFLLEGKGESAFVILKDLVSLKPGWEGNSSAPGASQGLAQGADPASAQSTAPGAAPAYSSGLIEKEALFLLWSLASTNDIRSFSAPSTGYEAPAMASLLEARYPRSVETSMVQRGVLPTPGAWLLGGLFPFPELGPESAGIESEPGAGPGKPDQATQAQDKVSSDKPVRLQAGWFSRKDNADNLGASLRKAGFTVSVQEQKTSDGQARWAVIVDTETDWTKTQAKLKDLGYESYLLP